LDSSTQLPRLLHLLLHPALGQLRRQGAQAPRAALSVAQQQGLGGSISLRRTVPPFAEW